MRFIFKLFLGLVLIVVVAAAGFRGATFLREGTYRFSDPAPGGSFVATDLGEVYVREAGPSDGVPVLLVHGSVGWSELWDDTSRALGDAGYRAISFDMPPMGYSEPDSKHDYNRTTQAARIDALARAMEIKPHLVAHSFGAGAAVEAAMRTQERFTSLVIVNGALGLEADPEKTLPLLLRPMWLREVAVSSTITNPLALKPLLRQFLHRKDTANGEVLEILKQPFEVIGATENIAHWLPTLFVPPKDAMSMVPARYADLALPTGIIWGREDTATPLAQGEALHALIPGSQLLILDDIGHIPQIEGPAELQEALVDLLGSF
ncbi:MAG: alpha/beta hydrolase [Pseudomonadota bacterium]